MKSTQSPIASYSPPQIPDDLAKLEDYINRKERETASLKKHARAKVVWADPGRKVVTEYALVYLHGFTASHGEGYPCHLDFARRYRQNLYLSRLSGHGLHRNDPLRDFSYVKLIHSAISALKIGQKLGKKVILMGTSAGASLGLYLASKLPGHNIAGLILYSPLIDFYGIKSLLLTHSIPRNILRFIPGKRYMITSPVRTKEEKEIWYDHFSMGGVVELGAFTETYMTPEIFSGIDLPVFTGYYYRDREHQDNIISVPAIRTMVSQLGTEPQLRQIENFPTANTHVICNHLLSGAVNEVRDTTFDFAENILRLIPAQQH